MKLFARNVIWVAFGQVSSVLVQAAYFMLLTRLLGAHEFGVYAAVLALVIVVSPYANLGSGSMLIRRAAVDPSTLQLYWGNVLFATSICGSLVVVIICGVGHIINPSAPLGLLLTVAVSECMFQPLVAAASQAFQSQERMRAAATINLSTNLARLITVIALLLSLHHGTTQQWALGVLACTTVVAALAMYFVARSFGRPKFYLPLLWQNAAEGLSYSLSFSTTSLYNDLDKILLGRYGFIEANGIYSAAYRVLNAANMPAYALYASAFPRFFRLGAQGVEAAESLARKLTRYSFPAMIAISVGLFVVAPYAAAAFGPGFSETGTALRWLCLLPLLRSLQWSAGDAISGVGKQHLRLALQAIAVLINFGSNLILIPRYSWRGAAWSTLITDGCLAAMSWAALSYLKAKHFRLLATKEEEMIESGSK